MSSLQLDDDPDSMMVRVRKASHVGLIPIGWCLTDDHHICPVTLFVGSKLERDASASEMLFV